MQTSKKIGLILYPILALVIPICVESVYLYHTRLPVRSFTETTDDLSAVLSIALGYVFVFFIPSSLRARVAIGLLYLPIMVGILLFYALWFVCFVCGDCL